MRKTKIVCTLGPASESEPIVREMILAGMNVARFNFSHGTHEEHLARFTVVDKLRKELGLPVATLLDTKGPEIRCRDFAGGKVTLTAGSVFTLLSEEVLGDETRASVSYPDLWKDVSIGDRILIDDGLVAMRVTDIQPGEISCVVINGGEISNHKGITVPGVHHNMP